MAKLENFIRSLRYLKPYRKRLGVSIVCVLLIMVLWGGGLAIVLPGAKILVSDEGLHNWVWNEIAEDRLGATVTIDSTAMIVGNVDPDGPAGKAQINKGDWIVSIAAEDSPPIAAWPAQIAREITEAGLGESVTVSVKNPQTDQQRQVTVQLDKPSRINSILRWVVGKIPPPAKFSDRFQIFIGLLVIGLALTVVRNLLRFCQEYLVISAVWRGIMDLRCDNYTVALHLPLTFFASRGSSDTMSRFLFDCNELARGQSTLFGKTMVEPAKAIASLAVAMTFSWKLTLIAMIAGPPSAILIRKLAKRMRRASMRALKSLSDMLAVLEETLTGIRVVKAYTMEGSERKRFFKVNRQFLAQKFKMTAIEAATSPAIEAIGVTAGMAAAAGAGYLVFSGEMDSERFLAWMIALFAAFDPVRKLAKVVTRFQRAESAATRIFELQDWPQEKTNPGAPKLARHERDLEFREIKFRYPSAGEDTLSDVNLKISAGQTVAIVGPNGCGKTTLVSMIPRLFDPSGGQILIDGKDIADFSMRSVRRQIGLVTQDSVLFNATIAENISYGLRRPRKEAILEAAKKAFVDEFVKEMPDGYDTIVGEHGATLSGGQKQRISIARAILRDPAILIFDEAMSQIDSHSEQRIHQAMSEFIQGRTTLMVAHRFALIKSADLIVVMDAGKIIDTGKHKELITRCQIYQHLCQTQFIEVN